MKLAGCRSPQLAQIQGFPLQVCRAQGWGKVNTLSGCALNRWPMVVLSYLTKHCGTASNLAFVSKIELFRGDSPEFGPTG